MGVSPRTRAARDRKLRRHTPVFDLVFRSYHRPQEPWSKSSGKGEADCGQLPAAAHLSLQRSGPHAGRAEMVGLRAGRSLAFRAGPADKGAMAESVMTLIAATSASSCIDTAVAAVVEALRRLGASVALRDWLAPGIACDIPFADLDTDPADAAARAAVPPSDGNASMHV